MFCLVLSDDISTGHICDVVCHRSHCCGSVRLNDDSKSRRCILNDWCVILNCLYVCMWWAECT